ncbi:MAG: hypothetical protein K2L11_07875, partial [Muribaculaceae bacterium]|nr:hypothetical protein [Muribaculaceae bacterium]
VPTFTRIDPMAEKYPWLSPYLYCANNPPHPRPRRVESPQPICRPSFSIQSFRYRLASSIPFKKKPHSENDSACDNYQVFQRVQSPSFAVFIFFN